MPLNNRGKANSLQNNLYCSKLSVTLYALALNVSSQKYFFVCYGGKDVNYTWIRSWNKFYRMGTR